MGFLRFPEFRCQKDGYFEVVINAETRDEHAAAAKSQPCPKCGESAPGVWRRAPSMRNGSTVHGVRIGGQTYTMEQAEQILDAPDADDDSDAFWNSAEFEGRWDDATNKTLARALAGDLPPLVPDDANSQKVFADAMSVAKE